MKHFLVLISVFAGNYILAQNVGIGTSSPQFPLSFPGTLGDKISLWGDGTATHYGIGIQSNLLQIFVKGSSHDIAFGYGSSTSFTERMRIKGNGNVGIGTVTPAATLDVNGQVKISGGSPGDGKVLTSDASGNASWSNSSINTGAFAYSGGSTPQSIAHASTTVMAFPSIYLSGNNFSTVDYSYTAPTAGFYHFDMLVTIRILNPFAGDKQLFIGYFKNSNSIWNASYIIRSSIYDESYPFSFSLQMSAGDKVDCRIAQYTGMTQQLNSGYFQGYRVY